MLHPQARALLDLMAQRGVPPMHTLTPAEARRMYLERRSFTQPDAPAVGDVHDLRADGPHGGIALREDGPEPREHLPVGTAVIYRRYWTAAQIDIFHPHCVNILFILLDIQPARLYNI